MDEHSSTMGKYDDAAGAVTPQEIRRAGLVPVLAAVIRRGERVLVALRPDHKRHGGLWEFPGGKLEADESWLDGAKRELAEELGVEVERVGVPLLGVRDSGSRFVIVFVDVEISGQPEALEHAELRWAGADELAVLTLAPADRLFVEAVI